MANSATSQANGANPLHAAGALPRFDEIEAGHVVPGIRALLAELEESLTALEAKVEHMRKLQASARADEQGERAELQAGEPPMSRASIDSELAACEADPPTQHPRQRKQKKEEKAEEERDKETKKKTKGAGPGPYS